MLHFGKKSLFWNFVIFRYRVSKWFRDKTIGFNSCECIKFLNIANFHVWEKRILTCNDSIQHFSFTFFLFLILQSNFFPLRLHHQTSATKLRYLRSSPFYRQPIFIPKKERKWRKQTQQPSQHQICRKNITHQKFLRKHQKWQQWLQSACALLSRYGWRTELYCIG